MTRLHLPGRQGRWYLSETQASVPGRGCPCNGCFSWVLQEPGGAIVVFDADTSVDPSFLRIMDARLANGSQVIQGQHVISNPSDGWFPL